jgi:uncharacterized protein DUF3553
MGSDMPTLKTGDCVRHSSCPDWGVGLVADIRGSMAVVLFENSQRPREFRVPAPYLVPAPQAEPPKVSHLKAMLRASGVKRRATVPRAARPFDDIVIEFRNKYEGGFSGAAWRAVREERDRMEKIVRESIGPKKWKEMLGSGAIGDLAKAHRTAVQTSGLMHPVQAVRITNIADGGFWSFYGDWVWSSEPKAEVFEEVVKGLVTVGQATWPNVSALRGLVFPASDLFVKPDAVKRTAASLRAEIPYETRPTYRGYQAMLEFAKKVRERLEREGFKPHDNWDVIQFCKIVAGGAADGKPKAPATKKPKAAPADV